MHLCSKHSSHRITYVTVSQIYYVTRWNINQIHKWIYFVIVNPLDIVLNQWALITYHFIIPVLNHTLESLLNNYLQKWRLCFSCFSQIWQSVLSVKYCQYRKHSKYHLLLIETWNQNTCYWHTLNVSHVACLFVCFSFFFSHYKTYL